MANPHVREKLSFYPEDCAAKSVSQARQFARWLNEVPDDQLGPMARIHGEDYYIFEPCMLRSGLVYMPHRWFRRQGCFYAYCWKMEQVPCREGKLAWRVVKGEGQIVVSEDEFLLSFPRLVKNAKDYPHLRVVTQIEGLSSCVLRFVSSIRNTCRYFRPLCHPPKVRSMDFDRPMPW